MIKRLLEKMKMNWEKTIQRNIKRNSLIQSNEPSAIEANQIEVKRGVRFFADGIEIINTSISPEPITLTFPNAQPGMKIEIKLDKKDGNDILKGML